MSSIKKQLMIWFGILGMGAAVLTGGTGVSIHSAYAASDEKTGIILMHGKGGTQTLVASLGAALEDAGMLVATPLMPWSASRIYDKGYEEAMAEIDSHAEALRKAGARKILVAGHSLGANAALGYAARRDGLAGVILLAYGHVPEKRGLAKKLKRSVSKARVMIDDGKGEDIATFDDFGGSNSTAQGSANDIMSWYDPDGPATISRNAPEVKPNTPVLCIDGENDKWQRCDEIMGMVPSHSKNLQARVDADHRGTPAASRDVVLKWITSLDQGSH